MSKAIASWNFSAHEYSEDELVHIAFLMLQHALAMPELEKWRLPAGMISEWMWSCTQCAETRHLTSETQMN